MATLCLTGLAVLSLSGGVGRPLARAPVLSFSGDVGRPLARAPAAAPRVCVRMLAAAPTDAELQALLDGPAKKPAGKVRKALDKPQGVLTIIGGYSTAWESIGFARGEVNARELDDVVYVSRQFRLGGAIAVAPAIAGGALPGGDGAAGGGCTSEQLRLLMEEQQRAKGDFPGPCAVFLDGLLSAPLHLARAASAGCVGVCLDAAALGPAKAAELYATAQHLGLEVLAIAAPTAESIGAAAALSANAGMVCVRAGTPDAAAATIPLFPNGVLRLASCEIADVRAAWKLRDAGFNALLTNDSLLKQATVERVEIQTVLKAIRAKGSAKYGKGASLGRGEGAKEVLGTMSI